MKNFSPLLTASVAVNLALVAWLLLRPSLPPPPSAPSSSSSAALPSTSLSHSNSAPAPLTPAQSAALQSADLDRMKAAGVPDDVAHILAAGRAYAKMNRLEQAQKKFRPEDPRYWRNSHSSEDNRTEEQQAEYQKAYEEFNTAMERAFPEFVENETAATPAFLPAAARRKIARIEKDYAELESEIRSHAVSGILLSTDTAKLRLLKDEKQRDLANALSPAELEEFQLHDNNSGTVGTVRSSYGDLIESEADYRKIFALQKAFDAAFPARSDTEDNTRDAAHAQLRADIFAVIGEEKYAAFQHEHDRSYNALTAIAERLKLPTDTPNLIYAARDRYAAESQAIAQNSTLSHEAQRAQLNTLAEKARADLETRLGPEGTQAYVERSEWLTLLQGGSAFSTNLKDAPIHTDTGVTEFRAPRPRR